MAKIDVVNLEGKKTGSLELAEEVFGGINEDLLWEAVKHYRSAHRAGTAATKNRKLVAGSGKKLWKQKGTGRARVGSVRSPLWRHGGTVHGPQPRSYDYQFPKKKLLGALRSALASKFSDGKLMVVEGAKDNRNLQLSSRNIPGVELVSGNHVHPYHLLRYETAIFSKPALEKLQDSLKASAPKHKHDA